MASISFNPQATTAPQNSFLLQTEGYVQGALMDDPSSRMYLSQGSLASTETLPMWGGIAIGEDVSPINGNQTGPSIVRATTIAGITGFSVNNQAYNMIITPGNTVPLSTDGMSVMFARFGSNSRIAVQCDSTLAAALSGNLVNQQVTWDFTNQKLSTYSSGTALPVRVLSVNSNSKIVSYDSGTGAVTWTTGASAIILL